MSQSDSELLRDVALSGVEFDDPRIGYVTVQIDRVVWEEIVERWATGRLPQSRETDGPK